MPVILELQPLFMNIRKADEHGPIVERVEGEFNGEATVDYLDTRPVAAYSCVLRQRSAISRLSLRQLFVLKWVRMCDVAGLIPVLTDSPYETVLARCYVGGIQGSEPFKTSALRPFGVQKPENGTDAFFDACVMAFSLPFDDVYREVTDLVKAYLSRWPDTPMAKFARLNLGKVPEREGEERVAAEASPSPSTPSPAPRPATAVKPETTPTPTVRAVTHASPSPEPSTARKPEMLTELLLTPIFMDKVIPSSAHGHVVAFVEKELSNSATTLIYIDDRGASQFFHVMTLQRAIGTLPVRHLFCLKWLRMLEYSGVLPDMLNEDYERFAAQMYAGIMNADSKAAVTFQATKRGGSSFEEMQGMLQEKCLHYYTPIFENVFNDTVETINSLGKMWPDSAMIQFGLRHLNGGSSGWATSR